MCQRFALLAVLLSALPAAADDKPPPFDVPKSWEKLHDGPNAAAFLHTRGGYTVWIEQMRGTHVSPAPRAILYTYNVLRQKAGDKEPETLQTLSTTGTVVTLAGPKGEVAVGEFAHCEAVYLPGHKPLKMPADARYTA